MTEEPWMTLASTRRWFGKLKNVAKVHTDYVDLACVKGLPFHRDPVTGLRYWLESELIEFVRTNNERTKNLPLRVPSGPKRRVRA